MSLLRLESIVIIIVLTIGIGNYAFGNSINDIRWVTEKYPPFNYVDDQGVLRGITVDILTEMWKKIGLKKK